MDHLGLEADDPSQVGTLDLKCTFGHRDSYEEPGRGVSAAWLRPV